MSLKSSRSLTDKELIWQLNHYKNKHDKEDLIRDMELAIVSKLKTEMLLRGIKL